MWLIVLSIISLVNTAVAAQPIKHLAHTKPSLPISQPTLKLEQEDQDIDYIEDEHLSLFNEDPYENFNRAAFRLNDQLDKAILKPLATIYNTIVPWPLAKGISNVYGNLLDIPTIPNDILQGKFTQMVHDLGRVVINSTLGIFGLFDVATPLKLEKRHEEDLGLTLAYWGYKKSNYFVIPLFGASTVRDTIARPANYFFTVYPYIHDETFRNFLLGGSYLVTRADSLKYQKVIEAASFDPYIFYRNAYMQYRQHMIEENETSQKISKNHSLRPSISNRDSDDPYVSP